MAVLRGRSRIGLVAAFRRRPEWLLPLALLALLLQIAAPVGASWLAVAALADPLSSTEICHHESAALPAPAEQGGDRRACGVDCLLCCVLHAGGALDAPRTPGLAAPQHRAMPVVWHGAAPDVVGSRRGSNAQARAPPRPS
jgi:hypothetical protein